MNMISLHAHQEFFGHTTKLSSELHDIEENVRAQETRLLLGISDLTASVRSAAGTQQPELVRQAVDSYFCNMADVLDSWEKKVASYDAGLTFRKQFGDSLLLFIYGKVKAGKSSLGNFVATGQTGPDEHWLKELGERLHTPKYFCAEKNDSFGEVIDYRNGFQVGGAETTSCIQGFTVPGLTWVDSPGLHSVSRENGELAQKYVDSADLIIYPMNSAQPGRQSDLQELEKLLEAGKRILVLITRCDTREVDVNSEGDLVEQLVMKTASDRLAQKKHVQNELDASCRLLGLERADVAVLTVSVEYAVAAGNSTQAMQESGLQDLFDTLIAILHSEGITLKKQVPQRNLQAFYRLLLADEGELSINLLTAPLDEAMQKVDALRQQLDEMRVTAQSRIEFDFARHMDELVENAAAHRNVGLLSQQLQQLVEDAIFKHYRKPLNELYENALGALNSLSHNMGLGMGLQFEDKAVLIKLSKSNKHAAVGAGVGTLLGTGLGALIAGPPGAMVGSTMGSFIGGLVGRSFNIQEERVIKEGDNREEIKTILLKKGSLQVAQIMNGLNLQAREQILDPVHNSISQVQRQTDEFMADLRGQYNV
ncbi:MAG: dynamin family protein [Pseudomonas profundi]|uniref:dynamin family protein n=1 Tax=Pseudomonas profundi TaxID=1981513 RepID=UPI00300397E7